MAIRKSRRADERAWWIVAPLVALTVVMMVPIVVTTHPVWSSWQLMLLFFLLFGAAEATNLNFEVRRHTMSVTITEIPLLLGLFYLSPLSLILVRLASWFVIRSRRKLTPVKFSFNMANVAAGISMAEMVVFLSGHLAARGPSGWLILLLAVNANVLAMMASVVSVITLVQGGTTLRRLASSALPGILVGATNAIMGLIVLITIQGSRWAVILLAALAAVMVVVYRAYGQFLRQHKSLSEMYDLTRALTETRHDGTLADVLLGRVRELLQAEYATLWLPGKGRHPEMLLSARVDDTGLIDLTVTPPALRTLAVKTGSTVAVGPKLGNEDLRFHLRECGTKDVIVVPLRSAATVIGTLEVAGRISELATFGPEDVRLLETVAAHAAVAVENSRLVDRLRFDAHHDQLTALPNRRRMLAALEDAVKVIAPGEVVALLEFDVAGLRDVNDSLGFAAGDKLLTEVARRLRELAPAAALVARVGGDQFAVLLRQPSADAVLGLATDLRSALQGPMPIGSLTLDVDAAVGVALHPDHGSDPEVLLQRADVATFAAKSASSAIRLFNLGLESRSARRLGLAGDLRRALDNGELEVVFQPKVALRHRQLVGVECLARWEHPAHGSVAPEDFVAVAEHTGQLGRLTEVVLREGLRRCRQWAAQSRPLNVAVNLSPRTLIDPEFPDQVAAMLDEYGVPAAQLTLEITEHGVVGGTDRPMPTLRRLHQLGVRLSVDDFGTGYSSLSYLRRLPVHEVKIDRSFVQGMATDPGDLAIVRAVVDLSRHFGLAAVAEGVESEMTLTLLEEMGCDIGQGFLFSRPLPFDRLEAWFAAQTESEPTPLGEVRRLRAVAN